jgi:ABC-type ATPase involved in cell division
MAEVAITCGVLIMNKRDQTQLRTVEIKFLRQEAGQNRLDNRIVGLDTTK